jgi:hypothetical protein
MFFSIANIVTFVFGIVGCMLPTVLNNYMKHTTGLASVLCLFVLSAIGAYIVRMNDSTIDSGVVFIRVFMVIGISQIVITLGTLELYRRLELQRIYGKGTPPTLK